MMEVDRRPPKTSERDPLVPFYSPTALTVTPTGGRAQTRVQHRPPTLKTNPPTTKQSSARKGYAPTLKAATRFDTSTTRLYGIYPAPYQVRPPKEHPDETIPPKPPYSAGFTTKTTAENNTDSSPLACGHKQEESPASSTDTTVDLKQREVTPYDALAVAQRQRWEHLQAFHAENRPWPADIPRKGIDGGSPLMRTMLYPFPASTQLSTYSWTRQWEETPGIDCSTNHVTARPPCLFQGMWNSRHTAGGDSSPIYRTALNYIRQPPARAKTIRQTPLATTPTLQDPSQQRQWEHMRAFHSSTRLWPSKERKSQTWMDGGSPLIWTTLYSPSAEGRLQTYAWTGYLENYMPWRIGQSGATARPSLVSHAMWNIQNPTLPQASANPSQGTTHTNHDLPEQPVSTFLPDRQQYKQPHIPRPLSRAQPTQQPAFAPKLNDLLTKQPPGSVTHIPKLIIPAPPQSPQLLGSTSISPVMMAIMIYLFVVQRSCNPGPAAPHTTPEAFRHWSNPRQVHAMKPGKSCVRWTTAIIRHLWNIAWDLLAHRNVESFV